MRRTLLLGHHAQRRNRIDRHAESLALAGGHHRGVVADIKPRHPVDDERLIAALNINRPVGFFGWAKNRGRFFGPPKLVQKVKQLFVLHGPVTVALVALGCARPRPTLVLSRPTAAVSGAINAAEAHEARRDHAAARASYQEAIRIATDPVSEAFARREFAEALLHWGEVEAAVAQLARCAELAPHHAANWHDLGIARAALRDQSGAEAALVRARELAPRDARPRIALAALRWRGGNREGAKQEYQQLLALPLPPKLRARVEWALRELSTAHK